MKTSFTRILIQEGVTVEENALLHLLELEAALDEKRLEAQERLQCYQPCLSKAFNKKVWCDVLLMDVCYVLLDCPWIYNVKATNYGKDNIYVFKHQRKTIRMWPAKPTKRDSKL